MVAMVLALAAQAFAAPPTDAGGAGGCNEFGCGGGGGMTNITDDSAKHAGGLGAAASSAAVEGLAECRSQAVIYSSPILLGVMFGARVAQEPRP
jgi:hypothetical protein